MSTPWTNPIGRGTAIRASDIQEIVDAINSNRQASGLPLFPWTYPTITNTTPIAAVQLAEMRQAIQDLWNTKNMGAIPPWTSGVTPASGTRIFASDPNDLRDWLNRYEEHGSVNGAKRGIHLRTGTDLRACDIAALNSFAPGLVVVDDDRAVQPNTLNYLKGIQASAEIFVRYYPTTMPVRYAYSLVDPNFQYTKDYPNPLGGVVRKHPRDVAQEIVNTCKYLKDQGLVNFRYITGNEPDYEWDPYADARWWTSTWEEIDHYYRDIYWVFENEKGRPVEMYPPAFDQYASVGVSNYWDNGTVSCRKVTPQGGQAVECTTYAWQFGDRGFDLVKAMLEFHTNGGAVGRVLVHNYFWPGYQAEQAVFNLMPQWLKDKIKLEGWPNRVTEFGWIIDCFDPNGCNANLDTTNTPCGGTPRPISSWGDYNDFVRISGKMDGYAVWLLSDGSSSQEWAKWVAVKEDCTVRPWFTNLIALYNAPP